MDFVVLLDFFLISGRMVSGGESIMNKFKKSLILGVILTSGTGATLSGNVLADVTNTSVQSDKPTSTEVSPIKTITPTENKAFQVTVPSAKLFSKAGKLSNRGLGSGTNWRVGSELFRNDDSTYFQVSTDEYVPATDGYLYDTYTGIAKVSTSIPAPLYDHNFKKISGRNVAAGSSWQTDRSIAVYSPGAVSPMHYYRVATDEWISSDTVDSMTYLNSVTPY